MYGNNEVERRREGDDGRRLDVVDIFPTLQGEGPYAGLAAVFVRLAGCHLRCYFCDTDFTTGRQEIGVEAIYQRIRDHGHGLVVLTGGEPLRQNVVPLAHMLYNNGIRVQVETAGTFWWDGLEETTQLVVSPKTAVVHQRVREEAQAWKYIVAADDLLDPTDGLPANSTQASNRRFHQVLARPDKGFDRRHIYVQPCDTGNQFQNQQAVTRCISLCKQYGYRLSLQQHKILGLP